MKTGVWVDKMIKHYSTHIYLSILINIMLIASSLQKQKCGTEK